MPLPEQIRQQVQKAVVEHAQQQASLSGNVDVVVASKFQNVAPKQPQIYWQGVNHSFQFWRQVDGQLLFSIYPTQQLWLILLSLIICGTMVGLLIKKKPRVSTQKKHQIRRIEL
jgi:hypothetical protein